MSAELSPEQIRLTIVTWAHLAKHTDWVAPRVALALIAERDLLQEKAQHLMAALLEYQQAPAAMDDAQDRQESQPFADVVVPELLDTDDAWQDAAFRGKEFSAGLRDGYDIARKRAHLVPTPPQAATEESHPIGTADSGYFRRELRSLLERMDSDDGPWLARYLTRLAAVAQPLQSVTQGVELTDAELDAIYPESHNLGTYHQEVHRTLLRKVIVAATGKHSLPVAEPAHPWGVFLAARADVLDWLHEDGHSDEQIAQSLCMDAVQVRMIRSRDRSGDVLPGYRSTPIKPFADVVVVSMEELGALRCVEGRLRELFWEGAVLGKVTLEALATLDRLRSSTIQIIAVGNSNGGSAHA